MTLSIRHRTAFDLGSIRKLVDTPLESLDSYDEVYFLGQHSHSFALRAKMIAAELPNFAGVAIFTMEPTMRTRVSQTLAIRQNWRFIELPELVARAASKRILVLDFNDTLGGKKIAAKLAEQGMAVRDFLFAMHQLDQSHTYQSVKEERGHALLNLSKFIALAERFTDDTSRRTLYARLQTWLTLDRTPLINIAFPLGDFINNFSNKAGLVAGEDDVFIDAGAAHGDTVGHFYQVAGGKYRAMHAFEPDSHNYTTLKMLCSYMPDAHAYFAGLGDKEGEVDFYENAENRFGSNFTGGGKKTTMKIMTIDGVTDEATLVKIDVEGWEKQVIQGGARNIAKCKPDMTISAYHYAHDIPALMDAVDEIARYKHVGLRHYSSTLYDTQLVYSDRQDFA
jgi:FkbM family methyltransferase